jgi:hypothetical protein
MSALLEVPTRVRDEWAAEIEAEERAADVAARKAEALNAERDEIVRQLPILQRRYEAARVLVQHALYGRVIESAPGGAKIVGILDALESCSAARIDYERCHSRAFALDMNPPVRLPALAKGETFARLQALAARS